MFAGMMFSGSSLPNFGLSKVISLGNKADVTDHDALDYLTGTTTRAGDHAWRWTKRFLDAASSWREGPLVVIKGGRPKEPGGPFHTGSLAGQDEIFRLCSDGRSHRVTTLRASGLREDLCLSALAPGNRHIVTLLAV
jgi:acyl-CoA synthetase (NDP forming)